MSPWMAAGLWGALLGGLGLLGLWRRGRRQRRLEAYLERGQGSGFWPRGGWRVGARVGWGVRGLLLSVGALALGGALADLPWGTTELVVNRGAPPLVIVMDVSWSMGVPDVPGGRMERARALAFRAVGSRGGGEVAVVAFAGEAWTLLPLTADAAMVRTVLGAVAPGLVGAPGSSAGKGLQEARRLLEEAGFPPGSVVLLLSDGEWHGEGDGAVGEGRYLARRGVGVWCLTVGTPEGGAVPLEALDETPQSPGRTGRLQAGGPAAEARREAPLSRADPEAMARVALAGRGGAGRGDREEEVQRVLEGLGRGEGGGEARPEVVEIPRPGRRVLLSVALLALCLEWILGTPRWRPGW